MQSSLEVLECVLYVFLVNNLCRQKFMTDQIIKPPYQVTPDASPVPLSLAPAPALPNIRVIWSSARRRAVSHRHARSRREVIAPTVG